MGPPPGRGRLWNHKAAAFFLQCSQIPTFCHGPLRLSPRRVTASPARHRGPGGMADTLDKRGSPRWGPCKGEG